METFIKGIKKGHLKPVKGKIKGQQSKKSIKKPTNAMFVSFLLGGEGGI